MARRLALLFLFVTNAAFAQALDSAAIDRVARDVMTSFRLPGMAVAVVKDDRVVYLKGFGVREAGNAAPVTPDTLFQLASTSKAFTATAMALLVDEKKVKWDDRVSQHIDYFRLSDPCADSLVTVRDILSHRTGLSSHDELWDYTLMSRRDIIRRIGAVKLSRPIRSAYQYNNIMFMTAGEVVASAAGVPWDAFLKTRIFEPLGMRNTVVSEADWERAEHATAYHYDSTKQTITVHPTNPYESLGAAGTIKSSARDMAQWLRFQLGNGEIDGKRLASTDALNETKKPQAVIGGPSEENPETNITTYGLGWRVQDYRGELLVWHSGSLNRFRAQVALLPKQRAGVVVLTNMNRGYGILAVRNAILDVLIGKGTRDWNAWYLAREQKLDTDARNRRQEREAKRLRDTKPTRELEAYSGNYTDPAYGEANVELSDGQLVLTWNRLRLPLAHDHFDTFSAVDEEEDLEEPVVFTLDPDREVKSLTFFGQEFLKVRDGLDD